MNNISVVEKRAQIGVVGGGNSNLPKDEITRNKMLLCAEEVGKLLAKNGVILISGGMDGVMEASCRGAFCEGGVVVGTPGRTRGMSNRYVTVEICTPIDVGDYLFAGILSVDSIIVFPGGAGTLAEVALAYRFSIPMIVVKGYDPYYDNLIETYLDGSRKIKFKGASSAGEVVDLAINEVTKSQEN